MLLLWAILLLVLAIISGMLAFAGLGITLSFFTKLMFYLALLCMLLALIFMIIEKMRLPDKNPPRL